MTITTYTAGPLSDRVSAGWITDAGPFERAPATLLVGPGFLNRPATLGRPGTLASYDEAVRRTVLFASLSHIRAAIETGRREPLPPSMNNPSTGARGALGFSFDVHGLLGSKFDAPLFGPGDVAVVINEALDWRPSLVALEAYVIGGNAALDELEGLLDPLPVRRVLHQTRVDAEGVAHHSTTVENDNPTSGGPVSTRRPIVAPCAR